MLTWRRTVVKDDNVNRSLARSGCVSRRSRHFRQDLDFMATPAWIEMRSTQSCAGSAINQ